MAAAAAKKEEKAEAKPGRSRLLLVGGGGVALLLAVGGGWLASSFFGGSPAEPTAEAAAPAPTDEAAAESRETPAKDGKKVPVPGTRAVASLGTFTVNLRGNGGGRVLRAEVQLEVAAGDEETITDKKAMLRDAVLTLASDYTYPDLEGVEGKTRLRDELLGRVNSLLEGKPKVERVYFTEFVVQ
jgi:flagellar basal body-associated protein FliL